MSNTKSDYDVDIMKTDSDSDSDVDMKTGSDYHYDSDSDVDMNFETEKSTYYTNKDYEICPNIITGCSLRDMYHQKFACKVHDPKAAENCFIKRVKDQVRNVKIKGCDEVCEKHKFPINLAASYFVHNSSEKDMELIVRQWYKNQFIGVAKKNIPELTIFTKSKLIHTLSKACKEALKVQDAHLDSQLNKYMKRKSKKRNRTLR